MDRPDPIRGTMARHIWHQKCPRDRWIPDNAKPMKAVKGGLHYSENTTLRLSHMGSMHQMTSKESNSCWVDVVYKMPI